MDPVWRSSASLRCLWTHRHLVWLLVLRDLRARYRSSLVGGLWSVLNPILLLAAFTVVFGMVVPARWAQAEGLAGAGGQTAFALTLFAGLIVFWLFSECLNRAPNLVLEYAYLVTKAGFPLEILPWVVVVGALFHAAVSFAVFLAAQLLIAGPPPWTVVFLPLVIAPAVLLLMGLSWLLASAGVYFRDVGQVVTLLTTLALFLGPIFYPLSAFPEALQPYLYLNPVALIVEQVRVVALWGRPPDWAALGLYAALAWGLAQVGLAWFVRARLGFADVV